MVGRVPAPEWLHTDGSVLSTSQPTYPQRGISMCGRNASLLLASILSIITLIACGSEPPPPTPTPTPIPPTATPIPPTPIPPPTATPRPTATPYPLIEDTTGPSIFEEIDALGASEFNRLYRGRGLHIGAYWHGRIDNALTYGVSLVEEPSNELVFQGRGAGRSWRYSHTEPHDGKVIVGTNVFSVSGSGWRTYYCTVGHYRDGTLFLSACVPKAKLD